MLAALTNRGAKDGWLGEGKDRTGRVVAIFEDILVGLMNTTGNDGGTGGRRSDCEMGQRGQSGARFKAWTRTGEADFYMFHNGTHMFQMNVLLL